MLFQLRNFSRKFGGFPALVPWHSSRGRFSARERRSGAPTPGRLSFRTELRSAAQVGLALGFAIIAWQSIAVSEDFSRFWNSPVWIISHAAWPAILFLAGFWLARGQTGQLLMPLLAGGLGPLILTVVCTAFVLGPVATTVSLPSYFMDRDLWVYFLNLVGLPQFALPGVFEFNALAGVVNEAVWAVPCFAVTLLVARSDSRIGSWRRIVAAGIIALGAALGVADWFRWLDLSDHRVASAVTATVAGQIGILAHEFRGRLRIGRIPVAVSVAGLTAMSYLGRSGSVTQLLALQLIAVLACVLAVAASSWRLPVPQLSSASVRFLGASLLVAFPIQQLVASWRWGPQSALGNLLMALPAICAASVAFVWISATLARMSVPAAAGHVRMPGLAGLQTQVSAWLRKKRRVLPPTLLLFSVLIVVTLAVLAMTLFGLQRSP